MPEVVTLTLSTEMTERLHKVANRLGKSVEDVLTEWLEQGLGDEGVNTLLADNQYAVWSPLNSTSTAVALQKFIDEERQKQDR